MSQDENMNEMAENSQDEEEFDELDEETIQYLFKNGVNAEQIEHIKQTGEISEEIVDLLKARQEEEDYDDDQGLIDEEKIEELRKQGLTDEEIQLLIEQEQQEMMYLQQQQEQMISEQQELEQEESQADQIEQQQEFQQEESQQNLESQVHFEQSQQQDENEHEPDEEEKQEKNMYQQRQRESIDSQQELAENPVFLKRVRRFVYEHINNERINRNLDPFMVEQANSKIAQKYAEYLQQGNPHSPEGFEQIQNFYRAFKDGVQLLHVQYNFEDDLEINEEQIINQFEEACNLLQESSEEKIMLFNPENNHIGIGVAIEIDWEENSGHIILSLVINKRMLCINKVGQTSKGKLVIKGTMLEDQLGVCAARIYDIKGFETQGKKQQETNIEQVGPYNMEFNKQTKEFKISFKETNPFVGNTENRYISIYVRRNPDYIPYKKSTKETLNWKQYVHVAKFQCQPFPNMDYLELDDNEKRKWDEEIKIRKLNQEEKLKLEEQKKEQLLKEKLQQEQERLEQERLEQEQEDQASMEESDQESFQDENQEKEAISNKEIREELEVAISEAQKQYDELKKENYQLQESIRILKSKTDTYGEKQGDVAMNEHKYLNTLGHVHQIRLDLKQTEEKYNKMTYDLQQQLDEKQKKCNEIKVAFSDLKTEVAKKAAFSRTDKPIPDRQIQDWDLLEQQKNAKLQKLRLDNIKANNNLIKHKKMLKKQEELAEGLHLIDFEQLKIENQTVNEKIEERNEDLHKLKKKNTNTVQILTHTKEKLVYIQNENEKLIKKNEEIRIKLHGTSGTSKAIKDQNAIYPKQMEMKNELKQLKIKNYKIQQDTRIISNQLLKDDYIDVQVKNVKLRRERDKYRIEYAFIEKVIKCYKQILEEKLLQNQKKRYLQQ